MAFITTPTTPYYICMTYEHFAVGYFCRTIATTTRITHRNAAFGAASALFIRPQKEINVTANARYQQKFGFAPIHETKKSDTRRHEAKVLERRLTRGVHDRQHDGGDPCDLAVAGVEDDLDVLEEDRDGLGEGVGEADGDEGSEDHGPAPAAVWRGHGGGTRGLGWHRGPTSRQKPLCETQKAELKSQDRRHFQHVQGCERT